MNSRRLVYASISSPTHCIHAVKLEQECSGCPQMNDVEDGPYFTLPDTDLNLLLNLTVGMYSGKANMDVGIAWQEALEAVERRLQPKPATVPSLPLLMKPILPVNLKDLKRIIREGSKPTLVKALGDNYVQICMTGPTNLFMKDSKSLREIVKENRL